MEEIVRPDDGSFDEIESGKEEAMTRDDIRKPVILALCGLVLHYISTDAAPGKALSLLLMGVAFGRLLGLADRLPVKEATDAPED